MPSLWNPAVWWAILREGWKVVKFCGSMATTFDRMQELEAANTKLEDENKYLRCMLYRTMNKLVDHAEKDIERDHEAEAPAAQPDSPAQA